LEFIVKQRDKLLLIDVGEAKHAAGKLNIIKLIEKIHSKCKQELTFEANIFLVHQFEN
jgi:Ni,Fe-hydrogenase maturation factor